MKNTYITLNFRLTTYKNEDETEQEIRFEGIEGWQNIQWSKKPATEKQIKLLAELSRILNELAGGSDE